MRQRPPRSSRIFPIRNCRAGDRIFITSGIIGKAWVANLIQHSPEYLAQWLRDKQPEYLVTTPAMAKRLAELALADTRLRTPIREIMTYGEVVTPELRQVAQRPPMAPR